MRTRLFLQGKSWTIESLETGSHVPAEAFLNSFTDPETREGRAKSSLLATMQMQADLPFGQRMSDTRFKAVTDIDGILEFKADQLRLFCFFAPGWRIILVNGCQKKSNKDKACRAAAERAAELRSTFRRDASLE